MIEKTLAVKCPQCGKIVTWNDVFPERPFCSKRCKLIDLGEWASEKYRIKSTEKEHQEND